MEPPSPLMDFSIHTFYADAAHSGKMTQDTYKFFLTQTKSSDCLVFQFYETEITRSGKPATQYIKILTLWVLSTI